jgi:PAS domain S-box-containing protein
MNPPRPSPFAIRLLAGAVAVALIAGATLFAARRADRLLRADLLLQARLVAITLCPEHVAKLTGTAADYTSLNYLHVHELLMRVRGTTPQCRFLYLMKRRPDGVVIFTSDSDPFDSKDHSPPGQTYDEAPAELHAAFAANQPIVRGPYVDRWGTWVSAFVPLSDPKSTMLGMDIDARDWKQKVALRADLPAGLTAIAILFGLLALLLQQSRRKLHVREAALRLSEQSYRSQFASNSSVMVMLLIDPVDGAILDANAAATEFYGYPREQLLSMHITDINTLPAPLVRQAMASIPQKLGRQFEFAHRLADGSVREVEVSSSQIQLGQRNILHSIIHDITVRKRAEAALELSEKHFRRLIENSHDIIYTLTAEGIFQFVSPAWTALLGHPVDQVVGQPFQPFVHPDDLPGCMVFLKSVLKKGQPQSGVEYRVRHADGSWRWHTSSAVPLRDETGTVVGLEGTASDVTLQKQATERIRVLLDDANQSRRAMLGIIEDEARAKADLERLAMAINQAAETVEVTDAQGLIQFVNPAFERVTGYSRQEALGQNPRILKSGKHDAEFYRGMWATLTAGQSWSGHLVNKRKDGKLFEEEATISPVFDRTGTVVNYVAVKRDVTREVQLQAQLQQAQKMESVGRLAGGVAHDFNNLLMGIMNYTELCRDAIAPDHPSRGWLDEIMHVAERSAEITRQLLAFARKQTIAPRVLDFNDALEGMIKLLRRLIGEDISLAWLPGQNVPPVKIDPSQVDQILANLFVNARDAIAGVGKVTLETGSVAVDAAFCAGHPDAIPGTYVFLAVSDDGCGMDQETLAQIFEPFFTTKGVGKGTGLGLATVYGIVKQNNGLIDVTSEPGKGSTFKIYLPEIAAEPVATTGASKAEAPRGRGETILLVEDEKSLRVTCGWFMEALGYKVLVAETPGEALKMTARHPGDIHVLLTDVVMPGMDGRQLAQRISAVKPGVKVLFMSGYTADVIAQRGVLEEGLQFLSKPFTRDALAHKLRQVIEWEHT